MRDGLAATGFDPQVPEARDAGPHEHIVEGHCGQLNAQTAARMALAQVARDQFMARVLQAHAGRGVVLLAGNGHVRTDIGAPRWLDAADPPAQRGHRRAGSRRRRHPYDRWVHTAAQPRPTPAPR
jgi:hypothetical protein